MQNISKLVIFLLILVSGAGCPAAQENDHARHYYDRARKLFYSNNYLESFDYYTLAMKEAKQSGNDSIYMNSMGNLGTIFASFGDYERAIHYYKICYDEALKRRQPEVAAMTVINLTEAYSYMGDIDKARRWFRLQDKHPLANPHQRQYLYFHSQATIAFAEGNYGLARAIYKKALDIATDNKMGYLYTDNINNEIGKCYLAESKIDSAIMVYHDNIEICLAHASTNYLTDTYKNLYEAYRDSGNNTQMDIYRKKYLELSDSLFNQSLFNASKDKLFTWEDQEKENRLTSLTEKYSNAVTGLLVIIGFVVVISIAVAIILRKNRELRRSYLSLYEKNRELMDTQKQYEFKKFNLDEEVPSVNEDMRMEGADVVESQIKTDYKSQTKDKLFHDILTTLEDPAHIFNPDFTITELAGIVNSNVKYVSQLINTNCGVNFKTMLNNLRIREACNRLADTDGPYSGLTIRAIAESVGYNSISNFINAFKRVTGMTPNIYQKMAVLEAAPRS